MTYAYMIIADRLAGENHDAVPQFVAEANPNWGRCDHQSTIVMSALIYHSLQEWIGVYQEQRDNMPLVVGARFSDIVVHCIVINRCMLPSKMLSIYTT